MNLLAIVVAGALAVVPAPPVTGDQLYIANGGDDFGADANIARFGIGAAGLVTPTDTVANGPESSLVFTPDHRFAYAAADADFVDRYRVGPGGALTPAGRTKASQPFGMAVDPHGPTLFVVNYNDGSTSGALSAFHIGPDGTLTFVNTVDTGVVHPKGVAVTPDGKFVYVAHGTPRQPDPVPSAVIGFAVGAGGRISAPVAKVQIGPSGHRAVITPDGKFLYVTMQEAGATGDVAAYRIGRDGSLAPVAGQPFEAGTWVEGAAITPDGKRLYVTALGVVNDGAADGSVHGLAIGDDGRLTEVASAPAGLDPDDLAVGRDGKHVYVADFTGNTVTVFAAADLKALQTIPSQGTGPSYQGVTVQSVRP